MERKTWAFVAIITVVSVCVLAIAVATNLNMAFPERAQIAVEPFKGTQLYFVKNAGKVPILRVAVETFDLEGNHSWSVHDEVLEFEEYTVVPAASGGYGEHPLSWYSHIIIHFEDVEGWQTLRIDVDPADFY